MLIKKTQTKKFANSKNCTIWEYKYPSKLSSFATALITGRYPEKGRTTNLKCEEIYYVISGSGIIHSELGNFKIKQGDVYFFKKGERYWVDGKKLVLTLTNTPKWTAKQSKNIN